MAVDIKAHGKQMKCLDKALLSGSTVDISLGNLRVVLCMDKEFTHGRMEDATKANTSKIKSMAPACTLIQTVVNIKVNGATVFKMGKDALLIQIVRINAKEFGKKAGSSNG